MSTRREEQPWRRETDLHFRCGRGENWGSEGKVASLRSDGDLLPRFDGLFGIFWGIEQGLDRARACVGGGGGGGGLRGILPPLVWWLQDTGRGDHTSAIRLQPLRGKASRPDPRQAHDTGDDALIYFSALPPRVCLYHFLWISF